MESKAIANNILLPEVARLVAEGHSVSIMAKGNSMLPFIRDRKDTIVLTKAEDYKVGDLLLCEVAPERYVLHRLISMDGNGRLTLMGDGNLKGTETAAKDKVMAKASFILRNGKRPVDLESKGFRILSRIWKLLKPFRRIILGLRRRILRLAQG
ncbi:MAG: S24/S26 family peptidase [Bacteroidales bacterium]|nr:S24/S26 family peptidase [Bacteroidales bacterium]